MFDDELCYWVFGHVVGWQRTAWGGCASFEGYFELECTSLECAVPFCEALYAVGVYFHGGFCFFCLFRRRGGLFAVPAPGFG